MAAYKNAVLFYFSGTGNTWWVAEELCRHLNQKGFNSRAYSIEIITPANAASLIEESTLVGFGYPIHGSDLTQPVLNILSRIYDESRECLNVTRL